MIGLLLAAALLAPAAQAAPAPQTPPAATADDAAETRLVEEATVLIATGKVADALPGLDRVIAANEARYASERRAVYSARSTMEVILYSGMAATAKRDAVVTGENYGYALFLKGFALIDLRRGDEARGFLERAIALSPMNAHYLGEYAEWHKARQDWDAAYKLFERASAAAEFSPDDLKSSEKRRALRGMGFVLSELGKYDEAEALFRQCLMIDPSDSGAKSELDYIDRQRAKRKGATS